MAEVLNSALDLIAAGYSMQFQEKGATHEGVLWASHRDQIKRFQTLWNEVEADFPASGIRINDLGCGYGAFFTFLQDHPSFQDGTFYGYDLCADFIKTAQRDISDPRANFYLASEALYEADYSFASGTFNFLGPQDELEWELYVKDSLRQLFKKTTKAMVFNLLNQAETDRQEWLYYADPEDFHQFCSKALSRKTSLTHNPDLKGFTICVRK
jgi:hypothetical protein